MTFEVFGITVTISKKESMPDEVERALETLKKYGVEKVSSKKQLEAQKRARSENIRKAREKIENAVNLLRMQNKAINMNSVAVASGCSINTVRKYRDFIQKQSEI